MTEEKLGVKETQEVLVAVNELAIFLVGIIWNGIQFYDDTRAIIDKLRNDEEFVKKMEAAADNIKAVPAEIGDLDAAEGILLGGVQLAYVPKILQALRTARNQPKTE